MTALLNNLSTKSVKMLALGALLFIMFVSFILGSVMVNAESRSANPDAELYYTNIVVQEGDTLWDIAREYVDYDYYDNAKEYMDELVRINALTTDDVYAGENLIVTYYVVPEN